MSIMCICILSCVCSGGPAQMCCKDSYFWRNCIPGTTFVCIVSMGAGAAARKCTLETFGGRQAMACLLV